MRNPKNATRMRAVSPETVDHEAIDTMVAIDDERGSAEAPVPVKWQHARFEGQTKTSGECSLLTRAKFVPT